MVFEFQKRYPMIFWNGKIQNLLVVICLLDSKIIEFLPAFFRTRLSDYTVIQPECLTMERFLNEFS